MNYEAKSAYNGNQSFGEAVPMKEPELVRFSAIFNKERVRMNNAIMDINERLQQIYSWGDPSHKPMEQQKGNGRNDIIAMLESDLAYLRDQNDALEHIAQHLRQLI
jgi:hypothetical protein